MLNALLRPVRVCSEVVHMVLSQCRDMSSADVRDTQSIVRHVPEDPVVVHWFEFTPILVKSIRDRQELNSLAHILLQEIQIHLSVAV